MMKCEWIPALEYIDEYLDQGVLPQDFSLPKKKPAAYSMYTANYMPYALILVTSGMVF